MQTVVDSDVFMADKKTICTQKIVFKIWENRSNNDIVNELADLLCQFADEPRVFKDIEFYIPQLAHLIIHLDQNSKNQSLERLAMVLCQNSVHAALELTFLFSAALEDYQPETKGQHNNECNPFYFKRCARLLQDVERAVIYGSQTLSNKEEKALKRRLSAENVEVASMNAKQLEAELINAKKSEIANTLSRTAQVENYDGLLNGMLKYKRTEKKSFFATKPWKERHFMVDQRVLLCFREPHSVNPLRTIPLASCQIEEINNHPKYGDTRFDIINYSNGNKFQLMAKDKTQRNKWVTFLKSEIAGAPMVIFEGSDTAVSPESATDGSTSSIKRTSFVPIVTEDDMTAIQRKRFHHFKQMRIFITNITNICERLRFKDRPVRKYFLRRDMKDLLIPPFAYLPLTGSLDPYQQILRTLPTEGYAFSTKARCPALMLFEMEVHPRGLDIGTFLSCELERYDENQVINRNIEIKNGSSSTWEEEEDVGLISEHEKTDEGSNVVRLNSILGTHTASMEVWKPEGTGITRLEARGVRVPSSPRGSASNSTGSDTKADAAAAVNAGNNTTATVVGATIGTGIAHTIQNTANIDDISVEVTAPALVSTLLGETFEEKSARLRAKSPYGHLPGWKLGGMIAKSNDDVRQEVFVMQLIRYYQIAFKEAHLPCWLFTYTILSTSQSTGLIELIPNASSLDGLKKKTGFPGSLRKYFEMTYNYTPGEPETPSFRTAMNNYISSMAGYSIVSYLLGIKDRHNGNIMIDNLGHIIHIDFGFVFGLAPGKAFSMEKAPWKLTTEMVEVMGGPKSADFAEYKRQCVQALLVARKHAKQVKALMEIMTHNSSYPAFRYNPHAIQDFVGRLHLELPDQKIEAQVASLVYRSCNHTGTYLYDEFQLATNGIAP